MRTYSTPTTTSQGGMDSGRHLLEAQFVPAAPVTVTENVVEFVFLRIISRGRLITKDLILIPVLSDLTHPLPNTLYYILKRLKLTEEPG